MQLNSFIVEGDNILVRPSVEYWDIINSYGAKKNKDESFILPLAYDNLLFLSKINQSPTSKYNRIEDIKKLVEHFNDVRKTMPEILKGNKNYFHDYPFKINPFAHQLRGLNLMLHFERLAIFADCGTGKTFMSLLLSEYLFKTNPNIKILVAGKLMTLYSGWVKDCLQFTDLSYELLWEPTCKSENISSGASVIARNHGEKLECKCKVRKISTTIYVDKKTNEEVVIDVKRTGKSIEKYLKYKKIVYSSNGKLFGDEIWIPMTHKNKRTLDIEEKIFNSKSNLHIINHTGLTKFTDALIKKNYDVIILDESTVIKNPKSELFSSIIKISKNARYRYILSGTPAPNSPADLWSQFYFLDNGIALGSDYNRFLKKYFDEKQVNFGKVSVKKYVPNKATFTYVQERTADRQYRIKLRDCVDMPEKTIKSIDIYLSPEQQIAYNKMQVNLLAEIQGEEVEAATTLVKLMKLRQITGGFAINSEGKESTFKENSKLTSILEFINDLPDDEQIVIFAVYNWEIKTLLSKIKNSCAIYGKISDKEKLKAIEDFKSKKIRVIICQPQSAAHGITFTNARYLLFYSIDYSAENNYQAIKRIERISQDKKMFIYYFIAKNTVDEVVYKALNKKKDNQQLLIDNDIVNSILKEK